MSEPQSEREALSARLWRIAEEHIVGEWICCDPAEKRHTLCKQGHTALGMARTLLVDSDPEKAWNPAAPLLDAVLAEIRRRLMQVIPTDEFGQPVRQCFNCDDITCFGCMQMPEAEKQMLAHALDLAQEEVFSRGGDYSPEDITALENLKRSAVPDRRIKELEAVLVHTRNALGNLIDHVEDPGTDALDALYLVSQATSGIDPAEADKARRILAERDARVIEATGKAIGEDSWSRRDKWGRYKDEEFESGMRNAESLADRLADQVRAGIPLNTNN